MKNSNVKAITIRDERMIQALRQSWRWWYCPSKQHIMGMVVNSQLFVFRNAIDQGSDEFADVEVAGIILHCIDWTCSICGDMRTWVPN